MNTALQVVVALLIAVCGAILLLPRNIERFADAVSTTAPNARDWLRSGGAYVPKVKANWTNRADAKDALVPHSCISFASAKPFDACAALMARQPFLTDSFGITALTTETIVAEIASRIDRVFQRRGRKTLAGPVYVILMQAPRYFDEAGRTVALQYNAESAYKSLARNSSSTDTKGVFVRGWILFPAHDKLLKSEGADDVTALATMRFLDEYRSNSPLCFMKCPGLPISGSAGLGAYDTFCGCASQTAPYESKCLGTGADGTAKGGLAGFAAVYVINPGYTAFAKQSMIRRLPADVGKVLQQGWRCLPGGGQEVVRVNASGAVECASDDGKTCKMAANSTQCYQWASSGTPGKTAVVCKDSDIADTSHWCARAAYAMLHPWPSQLDVAAMDSLASTPKVNNTLTATTPCFVVNGLGPWGGARWQGSPTAAWISEAAPGYQSSQVYYQTLVYSPIKEKVKIYLNCDNEGTVLINDVVVGKNADWTASTTLTATLMPGQNKVQVNNVNYDAAWGGVRMSLHHLDGRLIAKTDGSWRMARYSGSNGASASARYVHLFNPQQGCMGIGDVQVFSTSDDRTNIAKGRPVQLSSLYSGDFPGANAVDGNASTFAHTSCNDAPSLTIDLGSMVSVGRIVVYNRQDCCKARIKGTVVQLLNANQGEVWKSDPMAGPSGSTQRSEGDDGFTYYELKPPTRTATGFAVINNPGPALKMTVYQHCNYGGYAVPFGVGNYPLSQLRAAGVLNKDASSVKVPKGLVAQLFEGDNFTGRMLTASSDLPCLVSQGFNDAMSSLRVVAA